MNLRFFSILIPIFGLSLSCKTRSFSANYSATLGDQGAHYLPVAEIVGRVILPDFETLRSESETLEPYTEINEEPRVPALWIRDTVILELSQDAPSQGLKKGERVWLTWTPETRLIIEHDAKILSGVSISDDLKANMLDPNARPDSPSYGQLNAVKFGREVLPLRLDDYTNSHNTKVGPLMSLAGGRPEKMEPLVKLVGRIETRPLQGTSKAGMGSTLYIEDHPVMVEGSQMALVTFVAPQNQNFTAWTVKHWGNGAFNGREDVITLTPPVERSAHLLQGYDLKAFAQRIGGGGEPSKMLNGDRSAQLNREGFYIFGDHENGSFVVKGLTPRALMRADADHLDQWALRDRSKKRKSDKIWEEAFFDISENHLIQYRQGTTSARTEETSEKTSWWLGIHNGNGSNWQLGDKALLTHVFGGIGGPKGDNILVLGKDDQMSPGHFAFGVAEVIRDPFTAQPIFDITYHQIYAHSPDGILSGPQAWHVYMGSLRRGWAFSRPVGDVLYKNKELAAKVSLPLDVGGNKVILKSMTVLDALTREFDTVAAAYRTGFGKGLAEVNSVTSCSQDSILALNKSLLRLADNGFDSSLRREASRVFLKRGALFQPIRGDWMHYLKTGQRVETSGQLAKLVTALGSHNSMTPRETWNELNKLLGRQDTPTILMRTNGIMSDLEEQYPLEPTNVTMLADHLRKISGQIIRDLIFKDPEP